MTKLPGFLSTPGRAPDRAPAPPVRWHTPPAAGDSAAPDPEVQGLGVWGFFVNGSNEMDGFMMENPSKKWMRYTIIMGKLHIYIYIV